MLKRTRKCTELSLADVGSEQILCGWVNRRRNLGNLIFVTLRDITGIIQLVFDGGETGVELTAAKLAKIKNFAELACCYNMPFITFTDVKGICPCMCANNSRVMKEAAEYLDMLDTIDTAKVAVVYKKAIGLGYSLFASKSVGFDYTCAFANAQVALFDGVQGAQIELSDEKADKAALAARYANENADPIHAAKGGYIDAIIEPQFVKQHLIASLQMFIR